MNYVIERYLTDAPADDSAVAIGMIRAESPARALREAAAVGLSEPSDRYRAVTPRYALALALSAAQHRQGQSWQCGQLAVCGLLARTVRIIADNGGATVLVDGGSTGRAHVARGSLYPTTTLKGAQQ